jgi:hypothetical protein
MKKLSFTPLMAEANLLGLKTVTRRLIPQMGLSHGVVYVYGRHYHAYQTATRKAIRWYARQLRKQCLHGKTAMLKVVGHPQKMPCRVVSQQAMANGAVNVLWPGGEFAGYLQTRFSLEEIKQNLI